LLNILFLSLGISLCYIFFLVKTKTIEKTISHFINLLPGEYFSALDNGRLFLRGKRKFGNESIFWANMFMTRFSTLLFDNKPNSKQNSGEKLFSKDVFLVKPIFVTAFSSNHHLEARKMLKNLRSVHRIAGYKIVVYDLGLRYN